MSVLRKRRRETVEETDLDMVPIMNMFLVLIPFLLMSASFFHLKAINTSVPVLSDSTGEERDGSQTVVKLTVVVEIRKKQIQVSALSDQLEPAALQKLDYTVDRTGDPDQNLQVLARVLEQIKSGYPASDTLILIPEKNVVYDTIIKTMDIARYVKDTPLFPKVVLSAKVG